MTPTRIGTKNIPSLGVDVGRHRAAQVGEHQEATEVAGLRDEVEDEQRQLDHPEREGGGGGVGSWTTPRGSPWAGRP